MVVDTPLRNIHMKQKTCLLLLFFLLGAGIVDAQNPLPKHQPDRQKRNQSDTSRSEVFVDGVKTPKKKYRNQEDHARFGIKCYYNAPRPQIVQSVRSDYQARVPWGPRFGFPWVELSICRQKLCSVSIQIGRGPRESKDFGIS